MSIPLGTLTLPPQAKDGKTDGDVSVRRSTQNHIGVVTRVEGDYVFIRWLNSDLGETAEYQAHRDDVTPLAGWL
jgi:hypothetical protein